MKKHYYYLTTSLPTLVFGEMPEITFEQFLFECEVNLSPEDLAKISVLRQLYDIFNIRAFWKKEDVDPLGNYDILELEESLLSFYGLPTYVYDFLHKWDSLEDRLSHFPELIASYFQNESKANSGFLRSYLQLERDLRIIWTGIRAKQLGRDLIKELQFEDPNDDLIAEILAQKDAKNFVMPKEYEELQTIIDLYQFQPLELQQALSEYRFRRIEEMIENENFSIDRILGYMAQLIILEKWLALDQRKGMQVAEQIFRGSKNLSW